MIKIEWTTPVPYPYGQHTGRQTVGSVDGEPQFTLLYLRDRSARLYHGSDMVGMTGGEEIGESHVEHLAGSGCSYTGVG